MRDFILNHSNNSFHVQLPNNHRLIRNQPPLTVLDFTRLTPTICSSPKIFPLFLAKDYRYQCFYNMLPWIHTRKLVLSLLGNSSAHIADVF